MQKDREGYVRATEDFRRQKDYYFHASADTPIEDRSSFKGLRYFPVDPSFRFKVELQPLASREIVTLTTSKGTNQQFIKAGYFEFGLGGRRLRLVAYRPFHEHDEGNAVFVPFRDATSGKESYGAARYLDLEPAPDGSYDLDFNMAYNPYCAYSEDYICPLPPQENWLEVEIRAGEKSYH